MNSTKKYRIVFHAIFILVVALLFVTQGKTQSQNETSNDAIQLTAQLTDSNTVTLNWDTIFEANYYKVYRAEVDAKFDSTNNEIQYVELGISESNEFIDSYIKKDGENAVEKNAENTSVFLYYITAIDAWEKEIGVSNVVRLALPLDVEEI
ncbi:MAG: hypothetical protein V3V16_08535 [Melioribacteraceae bacterium]